MTRKTPPTPQTVTPGKPSVDYVKCLPSGKTVLDLVTVPSTANIVYTKSVSGAGPSATVIVKATAAEGFRLVLVQGSGWEPDKVLKNTATYKITFRDLKDCPKIAIPVPPQVTNPECLADGSVSKGSVVPAANTESITYKVDEQRGVKPGDEQVFVVTAKAINGFKFSKETIGEGWTLGGKNDIATYIVKFTDPRPCAVTPTDPTVTDPVCKKDGSVTMGTVTLPADTKAIHYEKKTDKHGNIIIIATAQKGYTFSSASVGEGWQLSKYSHKVRKSDKGDWGSGDRTYGDGNGYDRGHHGNWTNSKGVKVATYTVKFADPTPCAVPPKSTPKAPVVVVKPSVTPVYTPVHALANTGADSSSLFIGAIALIVAGVASVALASRRRNEE